MASIDLATTVLLINGSESEPTFTLPYNISFRISDEETSDEHTPSRDREGTPFVCLSKIWLVLTTTRKPFDPLLGWVFGSNEELCDLVIDANCMHGVSGRHFRIHHDWESKSLVLTNISRHGTKMSSPSIGLRGKTISGCGTWRIRPDEQTKIEAGRRSITVEIPCRGVFQSKYDDNLGSYYREVQEAVPRIGRLKFHGSLVETPLVARGEQTRSQYTLQEEIGKGTFATVFKAFDPSTKRVYAAKKLVSKHSPAETNILRRVSHVCLSNFAHRQVTDTTLQAHVVAFVDVLDSPDTILVMEYMAGGNLTQLTLPTKEEITILLNQQLLAVSYLHSMGITHRDIKPENILLQQRRPNLVTKLSDFGLSSEAARLVTFCGTDLYCAPEIMEAYRKSNREVTMATYTNVVDIWSLGIVGMEYTIGLPKQPTPWSHSYWTRAIESRLDDNRGEVEPLLTAMLQPDPKNRPSAGNCLSTFPPLLTATKALKRRRTQLSTIREGESLAKIPLSVERAKRARNTKPPDPDQGS